MLQQNDSVAIAAIAGMGGIGKTELAIQYANAYLETYSGGICWLLARSGDVGVQVVRFARSLDLNIPEELDLPGKVQYCWQHWREGKVLVVLDDVTEYKLVLPYLPPASSRFKVLITTRSRLGASIAKLQLDVLEPQAALELLESLVGAKRLQQEQDVANGLCEWLGYLPLGLELVGRYLDRKQDLSLAQMWQRLQAKGLDERSLSKLSKTEDDMTAQLGVAAAFELSWQELNDTAKELGCLLSLFALAPIPWNLVEQCLPEQYLEELEEVRDDILLNLHLLQHKSEGTYQLHQLIREFFQHKLKDLPYADEFKRAFVAAMVAVAKQIPEPLTRKQITAITSAMPHVAELTNNLGEHLSDLEHLAVATSLNNIAYFNCSQGRYVEAELLYVQALEIRKQLLGEEHSTVAASLNNLAELYRVQGRYQEAKPLFVKALALNKLLLGEDSQEVAINLNNLALLYLDQSYYQEAEPLLVEALALNKHLLGEKHLAVAQSLNNLAYLYYSQARYQEAEKLHLEALDLRKRLLGEEHIDVAESFNNLGELYHELSRYHEAESMYKKALSLRQSLLGEKHPEVATSLNNLALLYHVQGYYQDAEPLYVEALEIRKHLLGEEHPQVAQSLNNLAGLYLNQGRYQDAESLLEKALVLNKHLQEEHLEVAINLNNLGEILRIQGRYQEAEALLIQALELRKRLLKEEHPAVVESLNNLAGLYLAQGRYSEAKPLVVKLLKFWSNG